MAKGQIRGNKETKKPKQTKQPAPPVGGIIIQPKPDKTGKTK